MLHPVLGMESRIHNVVGLAAACDTKQGRKQLRASIVERRGEERRAGALAGP